MLTNRIYHPLSPLSFGRLRTGSARKGEEELYLRDTPSAKLRAGSQTPGRGAWPLCTPHSSAGCECALAETSVPVLYSLEVDAPRQTFPYASRHAG